MGIVYQKDFHNHIYRTNKPLSGIIRPALLIRRKYEGRPAAEKMQAKKSHIAIIIDEFGTNITMEDISVYDAMGNISSMPKKSPGRRWTLTGRC